MLQDMDVKGDARRDVGRDVGRDAGWSRLLKGRDGAMLGLISAGIGLHAFNQFAIVGPSAR
ncbi:hypothetical protein, partial [Stenotrophomonas sp. GbtcB23]|uniref:hypothetical protein n=1 Tax=Stenotrophomonas sp. GbtcB23 TaxID=2824768 RepID=UPI001C2FDC31